MAQPVIVRPAWRNLANGAGLAIALAIAAEVDSYACKDRLNPSGPSPDSSVLCAVLLGFVWPNTIGLSPTLLPGLQWVTGTLLRIGIALVGLRLSLNGLTSTAAMALPVVLACITTAIVVSTVIG